MFDDSFDPFRVAGHVMALVGAAALFATMFALWGVYSAVMRLADHLVVDWLN